MTDRPPSPELLAAASAVRRGATSFASRARMERRGVLTINQTAILGQLFKCGAMTPGELARRMRSAPQSLTRTFAGMERDELIRRVPDPNDGRQSLLRITEAGWKALREEMAPRDVWTAKVMAQELTEAEQQILVVAGGLLERLAYVDLAVAPGEAPEAASGPAAAMDVAFARERASGPADAPLGERPSPETPADAAAGRIRS
ncbi:MAG TPA: MarR family transcriptional regulator [Pseudonocardiaceae bacterium]|jgi:DNA-binding MarR family transcriptional regulator|nr:MarR family transcriptional regulator [Pseudonocardiaceae bacterium]